jgi:hypothetical protein
MQHDQSDSRRRRRVGAQAGGAAALAVAAILASGVAGVPSGRLIAATLPPAAAAPSPAAHLPALAPVTASTLGGSTPAAARNPGGLGWYSSNWAGYAVAGGPYSSVGAQWTVPAVRASYRGSFSALWVGIDGFTSSALIQAGTEADYFNGAAHYSAWWEILPAPAVTIRTLSVRPGDRMSVTITRVSSGRWRIVVKDARSGSYATTRAYTGSASSAEWIEEAPIVSGRTTLLAAHSTIVFDHASLDGGNPGLVSLDAGAMIRRGFLVDTPSAPDADADGFALAEQATSPPRPRS